MERDDKKIQGSPHKKRLGVALSGGGARGFAHAGALMAIEEAGLKPDVIAGVSAGAIIAVLYAAGRTPLEMATIFARAGFRDFTEINFGTSGFMRIDKFKHFIYQAIAPAICFEDLAIPTYVGVTDLDRGKPAYFCSGVIGPRLMASCSIPIVFTPIKIDGTRYVDGGVLRNLPAWIIRDKCDLLIGVNVSPVDAEVHTENIMAVAMRTFDLMSRANQEQDMELCDISVSTPDISQYAVFDLRKIKSIFMSGYIHTRNALIEAGLWNPASAGQSSAPEPESAKP